MDGANRHDMKLTEATLESIPIKRPKPRPYHRQHLCLDKGYDYDEVRELVEAFGYTAHIRSRGEEKIDLARTHKKRPDAGSRNEPTVGSTAFAAS